MRTIKKTKESSNKRTISVTDFKAKCLSLFKMAQKKGIEFTITNKGKPIAVVLPFCTEKPGQIFGSMKDKIQITGDIINFDTSNEWETLQS